MTFKQTGAAIVAGFVLLGVVSHVLRTTWVIPIYSHYELFWSLASVSAPKTWMLAFGQLLFLVAFIRVYTLMDDDGSWVKRGARFGVIMTLLTVVPAACVQAVLYPVPYALLATWIAAGGTELVLLAVVVARCCAPAREVSDAAVTSKR
ncbi:MAG: hypothetical protein LAO77_18210 [Acidobacteriia bacterium]|nr:hypothetical protein [Terriglobia bacterium]